MVVPVHRLRALLGETLNESVQRGALRVVSPAGTLTLAREHAYVALSRGRLSNRLIVAITDGFNEHEHDATPPSPADRLTPILNRSAAQEMAIEL